MAQSKSGPRDALRDALKDAINERDAARHAVDAARYAEQKAREHTYAAERDADELRAKASGSRSADDVVAAIESGVDDVLELARPADELCAAIQAAAERVKAWRSAADQAEEAIPIRQAALDRAEIAVKAAANAVIAGAVDIDKMLAEAQVGAEWLVGRRAVFLHLMGVLPHGPEREALAHFLGRPFLQAEYDEGWKMNDSIKPYSDAAARLMADPDAKIDIAP